MTLTIVPDLAVKLPFIFKNYTGALPQPSESDIWFPVPNGITSLPPAPAYDTAPELIPVNSTEAPSYFDPYNPDISHLFTDLLPAEKPPEYPVSLTDPPLLQPLDVIIPILARVRSILAVRTADYLLTLPVEEVTCVTRLTVDNHKTISAEAYAGVIQGKNADLMVTRVLQSEAGNITYTPADSNLSVYPFKIFGEMGSVSAQDPRSLVIIEGEGSVGDLVGKNIVTLGGSTSTIRPAFYIEDDSSGIMNNVPVGLGAIHYSAGAPAYLQYSPLPGNEVTNLIDLTVEYWGNLSDISTTVCIWSDGTHFAYVRPTTTETSLVLAKSMPNGSIVDLIVHPFNFSQYAKWYHFVIEQFSGAVYVYINGVKAPTTTPAFMSYNGPQYLFGHLDTYTANIRYTAPMHIDNFRVTNYALYKGSNFTPVKLAHKLSATLIRLVKKIKCDTRVFNLTGFDANFTRISKRLAPEAGVFAHTGYQAGYRRPRLVLRGEATSITRSGLNTSDIPTWVGSSTLATNSSTLGASISWPSGYAVGDIGFLVIEVSGDDQTFDVTYPNILGWNRISGTPIVNVGDATGSRLHVWWRRAVTTSEPAVYMPAIPDHIMAVLAVFRGSTVEGLPFAYSQINSTTTNANSLTIPGFDTVTHNALITHIISRANDSSSALFTGLTNSSLSGITERVDVGTANGNGGGIAIYTGSTRKKTTIANSVISSSVNTIYNVLTLALRPARTNLSNRYKLVPAFASFISNFASLWLANKGNIVLNTPDVNLKTARKLLADVTNYNESGVEAMFGGRYAIPPTFQAAGTQGSGTAGFSVSWPAHQTNDVAVLVIESSGADSSLTPPSGWSAVPGSPVTDVATTAGSRLTVWWKRATSASEAAVAIPDGGDHQVARIFTFRGCVPYGNPWDVVTTGTKTTASTTATVPSITTSLFGTRVVMIVGRPNDDASVTHFGVPTNANLTSIVECGEAGTTDGNGGGFVVATGIRQLRGAIGTSTLTKTASTTDTYMVLALRSYAPAVLAVAGDPGAFGATGQDSTLTYDVGFDIVTAATGVFNLAGAPVNISSSRKLVGAPQVRTIAGQNVNLIIVKNIKSSVGALIINGQDASVERSYKLLGDAGTLLCNTAPVQLLASLKLVGEFGSATLSGQTAKLDRPLVLIGASSAVTLNSSEVNLSYNRSSVAVPADYAITGNIATLRRGLNSRNESAAYTLSGSDVVLNARVSLRADTITCTLVGQAVNLTYNRKLTPTEAGSIALSGLSSNLIVSRKVIGVAAQYLAAGIAAQLSSIRKLNILAGNFTATGQNNTFNSARSIIAASGLISLNGQAAQLGTVKKVTGAYGSCTLAGQNVELTVFISTGPLNIDGGTSTANFVDSYDGGNSSSSFEDTIAFVLPLNAEGYDLHLNGQASFRYNSDKLMRGDAGAFTLNGQTANITIVRKLPVDVVNIALAGNAATLFKNELSTYHGSIQGQWFDWDYIGNVDWWGV